LTQENSQLEASFARRRSDAYNASWGELISVAPHPKEAPGFTTGRVLTDLELAADESDALRAELAAVRLFNKRLQRDLDVAEAKLLVLSDPMSNVATNHEKEPENA
jgi:hypothetical protein